jgi:signal transduction histidine kinase
MMHRKRPRPELKARRRKIRKVLRRISRLSRGILFDYRPREPADDELSERILRNVREIMQEEACTFQRLRPLGIDPSLRSE